MLLLLMTVWNFSSCSEENDVINDPDSGTVIDPSEDENKEPDVTEPEILLTPCYAQATEHAIKLYTYIKPV